jgi:hypothetical protein
MEEKFNIQEVFSRIHESMAQAEENVFKEVLRKLLKREPTIEDAKECARLMREGDLDGYSLTYKGLLLGRIQRNYPDLNIDTVFSVTFIPAEMKDFLEKFPNK